MSVQSVKLMFENATLKIDNKLSRVYTHDFLIEMTSPYDTQADVELGMFSTGPDAIPSIWSAYAVGASGTTPINAGSFLQDIDLKRKDDSDSNRYWIASCTWSPPDPGEDPEFVANPLDRPTTYQLDWGNYTKVIERDIFGNPVLNSADDWFVPGLEMDDARPILIATKNMWPLDDIIALSIYYKNAVNTDAFYGAGTREAKVDNIVSGGIQTENDYQFYTVNMRIQFNEESWDRRVLDRGSHAYTGPKSGTPTPPKERVKAWDEDGNVKDPVEYLDFANLNPDGTQVNEVDGDEPSFLEFRVYQERAFTTGGPFGNGLGIGGAP